MPRPIVTTGVPIDCVNAVSADSAPFGTELSPAALRAAGLPAAVGAADGGDLDVRLVGRDRDPATGVLGWPSVLATTEAIRTLVRDQVAAGNCRSCSAAAARCCPARSAGPGTRSARSGSATWTGTWTCTTARPPRPASRPTCRSR